MIAENVRDAKLLSLYEALTGSTLNGDVKEDQVIKLLYGMLCIEKNRDTNDRRYDKVFTKKEDLILIAKELERIYDEPTTETAEVDNYSMMTLASSLLDYMLNNNYTYKNIHSMNSYELKKNVIASLFS